MPVESWLAFVVASAVLLVIPGPTILTVVSYTMSHGRRARLPLVAAVALGDSTALVLSLLGLGALLATSAFWFTLIKVAGGLYLLYLGLRMLLSGVKTTSSAVAAVTPPASLTDEPASPSRWRLFFNTYAVTALNPKGLIFFVAFLPQFISPERAAAPQLWMLAVTFVLLATLNATLYAVFAGSARGLFASTSAQRRFNCIGGTLLGAAGCWALLARRPA